MHKCIGLYFGQMEIKTIMTTCRATSSGRCRGLRYADGLQRTGAQGQVAGQPAATHMSGRKARSTATVEDQEAAILDAAANEFAAVGARRANMDEVAAAAGQPVDALPALPQQGQSAVGRRQRGVRAGCASLRRRSASTAREAVVEAFATGAEMVSTDPLLSRMVLEDYEIRNFADSINTLFIDIVTERIMATMREAGATMPDGLLRQAVGFRTSAWSSPIWRTRHRPGAHDAGVRPPTRRELPRADDLLTTGLDCPTARGVPALNSRPVNTDALRDKVVVITGGARGIGFETATQPGRREGARHPRRRRR